MTKQSGGGHEEVLGINYTVGRVIQLDSGVAHEGRAGKRTRGSGGRPETQRRDKSESHNRLRT